MAKTTMKLLALTILTLMILATAPSFAAANPEWQAQPMHHATPAITQARNYYYPDEIKAAYNLPTDGGAGTIAIIDAYDNPAVQVDLDAFNTNFKLTPTTVEIHPMAAGIAYDANWAMEINLDVQWAHAIAPSAHILLVEAKTASLTDLIAAIDYAAGRSDVIAVSMSWGAAEFSGQLSYDSHFAGGKAYFASSGDSGAGVSWPSSSVNVVSVGGTTLNYDITSRTFLSETAWSGSGGGVSRYEPKPAYQSALSYSKRATPDVSFDADPNTGFLVHYNNAWYSVGGTSAGSPQWAAIYTLELSATNANFYSDYKQGYSSYFRDITSGSNGFRSNAATGYDLITGLGSPIVADFAPAPPAPDFSIAASPSTVTINTAKNPTGTTSINVGSIGAFTTDVTLSTSDPSNKLTLILSPSVITGASGSATLTITVPQGTAAGTYPITVQGQSGSKVHSMTVNVQVLNPDFTLTANPTSLSIRRGSTDTSTISLNPINGYTGSAAITTSAPSGLKITPSSGTVSAGSSFRMTVDTSAAARGTYTITVTGTDGPTVRTATVRVTVR